MSLNVLIIPEDFCKDEHILKPIIKRMLKALGKPANVDVCREPRLRGVSEALKWEKIQDILEQYPMVHVFLLLVDRDGDINRRDSLNNLEQRARGELPGDRLFFAEHAWQEIEVWALAGCDGLRWPWKDIRAEIHPKEVYYREYAKERGLLGLPFEGRMKLGQEAARNYKRIRMLCPEDIAALEERLRTHL